MTPFLDRLVALGAWSLDGFWLPVALWTLVSLLTLALDRALPLRRPLLRRDVLALLLATLPLALALRAVLPPQTAPAFAVAEVPAFDVVASNASPRAALSDAPSSLPWEALFAGGASLAVLLLAGARLTLLARQVAGLRKLRHTASDDAPEAAQQLTDHLCTLYGTRAVLLKLGPDVCAPFTFGVRRPVVVVPRTLAEDLSALRLTLLHEMAHVRHGDAALALGIAAMRALLVWHPLAHVLARRVDLLAEHACDAAVLAEAEADRQAYAGLLARYATPTPPQLVPSMAARPSHLRRRLLALRATLSLRRNRTASVAGALLLAAALPVAIRAVPAEGPELVNQNELGDLVRATFPRSAYEAGIVGRVDVRVEVTAAGAAENPRVMRSDNEIFDGAALGVARRARFVPPAERTEQTLSVYFQERGWGTVNIAGRPPASPLPSPPGREVLPARTDLPSVGDLTSVPDYVRAERQPVPVDQAQPEYPAEARRDGVEGRVTTRVHVRADGTVGGVQVIRVGLTQRGEPLPDRNPYEDAFVQATIGALQRWRFEPAQQDGRPVAVLMTLPVRYRQRPSMPNPSETAANEAYTRQMAWLNQRGLSILAGSLQPEESDRAFLQYEVAQNTLPIPEAARTELSAERLHELEAFRLDRRTRAEAALRRLDGR